MAEEVYGNLRSRWFDGPPVVGPAADITVYKANWDRNAWDRVKQRQVLRLCVFGAEAEAFRDAIQTDARSQFAWTGITEVDRAAGASARWYRRTGERPKRTSLTDDSLIAAIVAARLQGAAALLVVLALCLHAIDCGYRVEMEFKNQVPMPWEQELVFHLTPN